MEEVKRNCEFVTMVDTGEKPDALFCGALFDDGDQKQVVLKIEGGGRSLAHLIANAVEQLGASLLEADSVRAAAAFTSMVGTALAKGCGKDAMLMATLMRGNKLEEMLGKMMKEDAE